MSKAIALRDPQAADENGWRELWSGYNAFFQEQLPEQVTAATWRRTLDPDAPIFCRLAVQEELVVGFTMYVLHEGTWTIAPICYLEDLFVSPAYRGAGIGRALLDDLFERARAAGWSRVYWHTRHDNPARKLYDQFVQADDFVRYRAILNF